MILRLVLYSIIICSVGYSSFAFEGPDFDDIGQMQYGGAESSTSSITSEQTRDSRKAQTNLKIYGQFGSEAQQKFSDWANRVKISTGIAPRDAINLSNKAEMYALRKLMSRFVSYEKPTEDTPQKQTLKRKYKYYKSLQRLAGKLNNRGWSSQHVTVKQLVDLRVKGFGDGQSDQEDTLNIRDMLFYLQDQIDQLGGSSKTPFLNRIRSKVILVAEQALRAQARNKNDLYILDQWNLVKTAKKSRQILDFPWTKIASRQPGMGHFGNAFEYAMSVPNYMQLTYRKYFSVETIFWFASNSKMLAKLDRLETIRDEVDFAEQELKISDSKGRITINELIRFTRRSPKFRELSKFMYERYIDVLNQQALIKNDVKLLKVKVNEISSNPLIVSIVERRGVEEVKAVFEEFRDGPDLAEKLAPLIRIQSVEGVDILQAQKTDFFNKTGLSLEKVVDTRGDKNKLESLIRRTFPNKAYDADFMRNKTVQLVEEIDQQRIRDSTSKTLEKAEDRNIANQVLNNVESSQFFEMKQGRLVLKGAAIEEVQRGGTGQTVEAANGAFNSILSSTQKSLDEAEDLSRNLQQSIDQITFLQTEINNGQTSSDLTSSTEITKQISLWKEELQTENQKVQNKIESLHSHKSRFESARLKLASMLGLRASELQNNKEMLNESIQIYLKKMATQAEDPSMIASSLFRVLETIKESSNAIQEIATEILERKERISQIQAKLSEYIEQLETELPKSKQQRKLMEERHQQIYQQNAYYSEQEKYRILKYASMTAEFDENFANQYAGKYLAGFIKQGDTKDNFIENVKFHSFSEGSISFDLTLVNISENDNWETVTNRKILTLVVRPLVVKSQKNNFDFEIISLRIAEDGAPSQELSTEFQLILDSTVKLLNNVVESLNDTPYEKLRFKYFSHLNILRVANSIPIFESFPNFNIDLIELHSSKVVLYGDVSGSNLGQYVASVLNSASSTATNTVSTVEVERTSDSTQYRKLAKESSSLIGSASIKVNQILINDFYRGLRKGIISVKSENTKSNDMERFFEGLEDAKIEFKSDRQVNLFLKGDFEKISSETRAFYSVAKGISQPYLGLKKILAQAGSSMLNFVTFGKLKVAVDPSKYRSLSGKFAIYLSGNSSYKDNKLQLDFDTANLYDPINIGALQPYVGTAKVVLSVTKVVGALYSKLLGLIDKLPGVNFEVSDDRLDHALLTWVAGTLAKHVDNGQNDISISLRNYNAYDVEFNNIELIDGVSTSFSSIDVIPEFLEIRSQTVSEF